MDLLLKAGARPMLKDAEGKTAGELCSNFTRPPPKRQWEEERRGAMGERRWDYTAVGVYLIYTFSGVLSAPLSLSAQEDP
eukprot:437026-Prorocentrum_minimum.AAC.1